MVRFVPVFRTPGNCPQADCVFPVRYYFLIRWGCIVIFFFIYCIVSVGAVWCILRVYRYLVFQFTAELRTELCTELQLCNTPVCQALNHCSTSLRHRNAGRFCAVFSCIVSKSRGTAELKFTVFLLECSDVSCHRARHSHRPL